MHFDYGSLYFHVHDSPIIRYYESLPLPTIIIITYDLFCLAFYLYLHIYLLYMYIKPSISFLIEINRGLLNFAA